ISNFKEKIKASMEKSLSYMPDRYSKMLLEVVLQSLNLFGDDTISNVNVLADLVSKSIFETLFKN
ncbi:MAG: hypothetical protein QXG01_04745, partial [Candidatus Bathyarchaeia archaeon]